MSDTLINLRNLKLFRQELEQEINLDTDAIIKANEHIGDTEIHVTADEKSSWNGKADLSDIPAIPASLPANGGNADTVDGKHAADFAAANHTHSYAAASHNHDTRYYTEAEVNNLLAGKAASSHNHTAAQISGLPASLPANGGNASTANIANCVRTLSAAGTSHGDGWLMTAQHNRAGDGLFRIFCGDGSIGTSVNYADNSNSSNTVGSVPVVTSAALGLHRLASGTAAANAANCPAGAWYGQHG